jgi:KDEL-tailed cysteine endopeptidase
MAGVNVVSLDFDACSVLGIECPKAAGEKWAAHLSLMVPSHMPGGVMADIQIRIVNDIGVEVTCAVVRERLKKKSALRASSSIGEAEFLFRAWAQQHGVSLGSSAEYSARLGVFESNHQLIMAHNSEPGVSWEMGHNQFSALTAEEFEEEYLRGLSPADAIEPEEADFALRAHPPTAVDWTTRGAVTAVHDQGKCGSCWAFASVGALEGAWFLKTGALVRMSEQQLVDCDVNSVGCNGGFMTNALYYAKAHGLSSFEDYQYLGYYGGFCRGGCTALPPGAITMVAAVPKGDEGALAKAIALQPVAVAVNATDWRFYKSGIYTGECEPKPNHGVLAVGYGPGFFKIKNSWGIGWGESGYIRLQAGLNKCGIANDASYPIM